MLEAGRNYNLMVNRSHSLMPRENKKNVESGDIIMVLMNKIRMLSNTVAVSKSLVQQLTGRVYFRNFHRKLNTYVACRAMFMFPGNLSLYAP